MIEAQKIGSFVSKKIALPGCIGECYNHDNNVRYNNINNEFGWTISSMCIVCSTKNTWKVWYTLEIKRKCQVRLYHTLQCVFVLFLLWNSQTLCIPIYLSHSSTLNVGVVVVGVGEELCLLTRWFKDVSCTLSRLPRNALLWLANFSLFMGEPKITSSHDASPHITHNRVLYNWSFQWRWLKRRRISS